MTITLALLSLSTCVGAGLIAGVFFAFSAFIMKALAELPTEQGIAAMQRINVVVLNRSFLGVFVGTALLAVTCVATAFASLGSMASVWLLAGGASYIVGSFGVTTVFNVPRNQRLARLDARSMEAAAYWPVYIRKWLFWNHVRTTASAVSAACAALALAG
jgi:uncharacterized membrane protein